MGGRPFLLIMGMLLFCCLFIFGCSSRHIDLSDKGGIWEVYDRECRECHKANGRGTLTGRWFFNMPDFTDTKWQDNVSDSRLIIAVANGKGKMPGYKGKLEDREIVDLVKTCVRGFYPPLKK